MFGRSQPPFHYSRPNQISLLVDDKVPSHESTAFRKIRSLGHGFAGVVRSAFNRFRLVWWWFFLCILLLLSSLFVAHRLMADTSFFQSRPIQPYRQEAEVPSKYVQVEPVRGLTNVPEVITTPRVGCEDPMLPVAAVMTRADGFARREEWRNNVGRHSGGRLKPLFPLGLPTADDKEAIAQGLAREVAEYGDLLIGNFADVYSEVSTKAIMAIHWFQAQCDLPTYLIKIDEDVIVSWSVVLAHIQEWTARYQRQQDTNGTRLWDLPENRAIIEKLGSWARDLKYDTVTVPWWVGHVHQGMPVEHSSSSKNVMPDFPDLDFYPAYTSGPCFILHKEACAWMIDKRATEKKHYAGNNDAMLGLLANGTYLRPLHAPQTLPSENPIYIKAHCGADASGVTECPCGSCWSIQASDKRRSIVQEYFDRCLHEEDNLKATRGSISVGVHSGG